jgi:hypothetical protein
MAFDIKAWSDYGVAIVDRAAALAGLLFVAVSVNSAWFSSSEAHRGRAGQALVLFVVPLVTGILLLIPGQSTTAWYIDSEAEDPGEALQALGGAAAIIATAASGASMSPLVGGLEPRGRLTVVGAAVDPVSVNIVDLVFGTREIHGSLTGSAIDNEDNLIFSANRGVTPMTEVMPLTEAPAAYDRMMSGKARFRVVLDIAA